jgi:flagellar biosynthesis/type III secretory pathway protein FliH
MTAFILPAAAVGAVRPAAGPGQLPGTRSRLLKATDVAARDEAVLRRATEAAETDRKEAIDEAYRTGFAAGRNAAEQDGASASLRGAAALEQLAVESQRMTAEAVDATESALLGTVLELTAWVLRAEPSQASRSLLDRLSAAARTLTPGPHTVVRCSTEDVDAVTGWARSGVEVVPDVRLAPGEARLDRGDGSAVLTFSAALRRAAETLGLPPEPETFTTGPGGSR